MAGAADFDSLNLNFGNQPFGLRFSGNQFTQDTLQPRLLTFEISDAGRLRQSAFK